MKENNESRKGNGPPPKQVREEEKIKVLLADDHEVVRKGLRKIIEEQEDIVIVAEAGSGEEAISLARETYPDVILMDVSMPGMDGIDATDKINKDMPDIHIVGLTLHEENQIIEKLRNAGASAFLTKTDAFESLVGVIRAEASAMGK